jgi:Tfp pilus assembly protein FimT
MSDVRRTPTNAAVKRHSQAGFSLAELVVSLFVVVLLMVVILTLFDSTSKIARAQTYIADLQQSVRVAQDEMVRYTRMAARGGLTRGTLPNDLVTVEMRNNVKDGTAEQSVGIGTPSSPLAQPDTDILTVRGVFDHLFFLNADAGGGAVTFDDPDNPTAGWLIVQNPVPSTGIPQSLQPLIKVVNDHRPEALLIASPLGGTLYHVVELDWNGSDVTNPSRLVLAFKITGGTHNADYNSISANLAFPQELRSVAYIGILEEYRYYVRKIPDPGNPAAPGTSRLSRARFYPGTQVAYDPPVGAGVGSLADDIADDIIDLQVALAIDKNADNVIAAETGDATDEWLFNSDVAAEDDNPGDWNGAGKKLFYVRINTLARTARRDFQAISAPITKIEDHVYGEDKVPDPTDATVRVPREYRRRLLQTVVDLRNL